MKKLFISFSLLITIGFSADPGHGAQQWAMAYGGSGVDEAVSMQHTTDGGYIVAGETSSFWVDNGDIWILKLDSSGKAEWQKTYGGGNVDDASSIRQTSDGGYVVLGGTLSFLDEYYDWDIWVLKLDSSGNIEWQKTYGGRGYEFGRSIQQTSDGGYIVLGDTDSYGASDDDILVLKLNSSGNIEWQKTYGESKEDMGSSIWQTTDGGYIVAGITNVATADEDGWVLKLDKNGTIQWQKTYWGDEQDRLNSIRQTSDGGYVVAGFSESFADSAYDQEMLVLKLGSSGNIEWQKNFIDTEEAMYVQQTTDGGYVVAGHTYTFGVGSRDICVIKLDKNGEIPGCDNNIISSSTATVNDSTAAVYDTNIEPSSCNATMHKTSATAENSTGLTTDICALSPTTTTTIIQSSTTTTIPGIASNSKAIIVAGGGPYAGNSLWDATAMLANYAYKALAFQGLTANSIYYLTHETQIDVEPDGIVDYDADPTNENLEYAITEWAADADEVILYVTDHGGKGTFRMSSSEVLYATQLSTWLDALQEIIPGRVIFIYDACQSGSFLPLLIPPSEKERIMISSSSSDEPAFFVTEGSISFSRYFWSNVFDGLNLYESFTMSKNAMEAGGFQNALLDDNGNGVANEKEDGELARQYIIGTGTAKGSDIPEIGSIVENQTLSGDISATIWVENVTSSSTVVMVWALIRGPGKISDNSSNAVTDLPSIVLTKGGSGQYKGTYNGFTTVGSYQISVYAMDDGGNISLPKVTKVYQTQGRCPAAYLLEGEDSQLETIRQFRDKVLAKNVLGRKLIELYYKNEDRIIPILDRHPTVKKSAKEVLESLVPVMEKFLKELQKHKMGFTGYQIGDVHW